MRIDVVTIFPDYLDPLGLSLIGKARREGLIDLRVHDLREFTHDRHRTVDDTPFGGGAGMVMKPQPWSEALASLVSQANSPDAAGPAPRLVVPGPGGRRFTQQLARELAQEPWLAFACGRYEGIDERVYEYARDDLGLQVDIVSLGDYVLNGGEVAVLAMVEAVGRLLPGVVGNAESLVEESHEDGLLEYPIYTKPASWQGRDVPPVLLSGNHAAIAAWRHEQRLTRTAERRPDLLHGSQAAGELAVRVATPGDLPELFTLMRACWVQEAHANDALDIPALVEPMDVLRESLDTTTTWVAHLGGRLVGSVRAQERGTQWFIGRLMVAPDLQGRGYGRALLELAEAAAPEHVTELALTTGSRSAENIRMYRKAGYRVVPDRAAHPGVVEMAKRRGRSPRR